MNIKELNNYGISAVAAVKGPGSINFGIQWLKQQEIIVDRLCREVKNELELYSWKEDRWGEKTNNPTDKFNHHMDSIRYAMEDEMIGQIMDIGGIGETASSAYEGII